MDPNKDRREAVKRKTTQYLKRAEEIFITHLQDNLGKGSSHLGVRQSSIFHLNKKPYCSLARVQGCGTFKFLWFITLCHQGYSSLRFRPIRHLSSPVEDLEMCKVVGVSDKV